MARLGIDESAGVASEGLGVRVGIHRLPDGMSEHESGVNISKCYATHLWERCMCNSVSGSAGSER